MNQTTWFLFWLQVSILLNGMLDHSFRERAVRQSQGSRLADQILQRWEALRPWWGSPASSPQSKTSTLTLLSKVLQVPQLSNSSALLSQKYEERRSTHDYPHL